MNFQSAISFFATSLDADDNCCCRTFVTVQKGLMQNDRTIVALKNDCPYIEQLLTILRLWRKITVHTV